MKTILITGGNGVLGLDTVELTPTGNTELPEGYIEYSFSKRYWVNNSQDRSYFIMELYFISRPDIDVVFGKIMTIKVYTR